MVQRKITPKIPAVVFVAPKLTGLLLALSKAATSKLFGIDKDSYLTKLAKLHISLLTTGHPTILCGDSIAMG